MSKVIVNNKMNEYFGNLALEVAINAVRKCAEKYGFDAEEALQECGLDSIDNHVVFNKTKKNVNKKEPGTALQLKLAKPKFPFPYNGEYKETCCQGLKYNRGLFTQCLFIKVAGEEYCKRCSTQAEKNDNSKPDCGCIQDRINADLMDFRDPKGRAPIPFVKVMRKLKISQQEILEEAGKFNIEIQSIHFVEPPAGKKGRKAVVKEDEVEVPSKKGRPSKKKDVVVSTFTEENDLFATLTQKATAQEAQEEEEEEEKNSTFFFHDGGNQDHCNALPSLSLNLPVPDDDSQSCVSSISSVSTTPIPQPQLKTAAKEASPKPAPVKKTVNKAAATETKEEPKKKLTKEEKEAEKEAEKVAKLAAKEAEKAAKLLAKEAEKAAKLEEKKAAKLAEKKAAKEAAKLAEKKAEKEAAAKKKAEEEADAKKKGGDEDDEEDEDADDEDEELAKLEEDEDQVDEMLSCNLQQFSHKGKTYFKDQFDTIYSMGNGTTIEPEPIGKWNKAKRDIEFNDSKIAEKDEASDDEEQEEEYDA
jgi:hypothetical protein